MDHHCDDPSCRFCADPSLNEAAPYLSEDDPIVVDPNAPEPRMPTFLVENDGVNPPTVTEAAGGEPPARCNCATFGNASQCPHHTQADYESVAGGEPTRGPKSWAEHIAGCPVCGPAVAGGEPTRPEPPPIVYTSVKLRCGHSVEAAHVTGYTVTPDDIAGLRCWTCEPLR